MRNKLIAIFSVVALAAVPATGFATGKGGKPRNGGNTTAVAVGGDGGDGGNGGKAFNVPIASPQVAVPITVFGSRSGNVSQNQSASANGGDGGNGGGAIAVAR
jgi:hypothetical protein